MAKIGADVEVAIVPNSNSWNSHTAETIGATHGFLPLTISAANQKGEIVFLDTIGQTDDTIYKLMMESQEITITTPLHWNGPEWAFLANIVGDATKSGTSFPVTNTFNWQRDPLEALTRESITVAYRVNSDNNLIFEKPNTIVTNFTFQNIDGFLGASITLVDDTTLTGSNATNGGTEFGNLTYNATNSECILFNQMTLYLNSQGGGDPASGTALSDVSEWSLSIARQYDLMDDVIRGFSNAQDARRRARPIWTGEFPEIVLQFSHKTMPDAHIDDLYSANEYKAEFLYSESVGGNTHTLTGELGKLVPFDPTVDIERVSRLGQTMVFRATKPGSTPTGFATANPFHFIHVGDTNWTFETLAA